MIGDIHGGSLDCSDTKRQYLGIIVIENCPNCGNEMECNLKNEYFSYPENGKKEDLSFYCEKCEKYYNQEVIFEAKCELKVTGELIEDEDY